MSPVPAERNALAADVYERIRAAYGFIPNLFHVQGALSRAIEAETQLIQAVLLNDGTLGRRQKDALMLAVASACRNEYCAALFGRSGCILADMDSALVTFAVKLARCGPWMSGNDVEALQQSGFDDSGITDAVLTIALGRMLCTLATALRPVADPASTAPIANQRVDLPREPEFTETPHPYLRSVPTLAEDFLSFSFLREQIGFVPNLFAAQSIRPDAIQAEVDALRLILFNEDALGRVQKENILLTVSAANLNTCCVAVHTEILSALGVTPEESDRIVEDPASAAISDTDKVLLQWVSQLAHRSAGSEAAFSDMEQLAAHGFNQAQVLEAVVMSALTNFLNTVQFGLGTEPDFAPRRVFTLNKAYLSAAQDRLTCDVVTPSRPVDPDAQFVARVQAGETEAFEELVRRHFRRIFGTLNGMLEYTDAARDAAQDVFLKAFEHIHSFQGRSKFSTWLTSIAVNSGTEVLRQRRPLEALEADDDKGFKPHLIQRWSETPEQLFAASQIRDLVRHAVLGLPHKYRVAVLLRDINQLSTEEAASAVGIGIPAFKARLLRGRLMLRESLAPHFIHRAGSDKC